MIAVIIMTTFFCAESAIESHAFETFESKSPFSGVYSNVSYKTHEHNKEKFDGYKIINGIDVSAYQGGQYCDYQKAKSNGVDFAIVRVSWTGSSEGKQSEDSDWKDHFRKAREAGMMTGIYHLSQATTKAEAKMEANYICDTFEAGVKEIYGTDNAKKYLELPIYMDYEFVGKSTGKDKGRLYGISKSRATDCAIEFCETIKARGYKPGIYASVNFFCNTIDGMTLGESYDLWVAQYYKECQFVGNYNIWQYSSSAKVSGIKSYTNTNGNVDVNFWYVKDEEPAPTPQPETEKSNEEETQEEKPVITPTTLKTVKGGKKQFTVTWTKQKKSKVDGYQIQYSRYKDMSYDLKKKAKAYNITSKTLKTNFRKYKYYVRLRTYKEIDGKTYYSKWSGKKTVYVK